MGQIVKIKSVENLTHDVLKIVFEKPKGYTFIPGQAADIAINKPGWDDKKNCFTFTSLPEDKDLEFNIKVYPEHHGMTNELLSVKPGDEFILYEPFGDIHYKGEGLFVAGGAGITPFIAILKYMEKNGKLGNSKLIFANKTSKDIIRKEEFEKLLGDNFINILSEEQHPQYEHGYVTQELLTKHHDGSQSYIYYCGPKPMMQAVERQLKDMKVDEEHIVREGF